MNRAENTSSREILARFLCSASGAVIVMFTYVNSFSVAAMKTRKGSPDDETDPSFHDAVTPDVQLTRCFDFAARLREGK